MQDASRKLKILFLCTGNSCRSQMAEAWARALKGDVLDAYSAGVEPKALDPKAVAVMAEVGVDISGHRSKHLTELADVGFDRVVTVCDHARAVCPIFPGNVPIIHKGFDDPPYSARHEKTKAAELVHYRRVRDEIRAFVESLPSSLFHGEGE
jgi:arsenate reductase